MRIQFTIVSAKENTVTTDKGTSNNVPDTIQLLYTAIRSNNITEIDFTTYRVNSRLIKAIQFAIYRGKDFTLNNESILYFNQLNKYTQQIQDYWMNREYKEQADQCLRIIFAHPELVPYYRRQTLQEYIRSICQDLPQSITHRDKLQHTTFESHSYDYDYVRHAQIYWTSLYDMLQAYQTQCWCMENGVEDPLTQTRQKEQRDHVLFMWDSHYLTAEETKQALAELNIDMSVYEEIALPFSACEKSVTNSLYSN